ncbi:hypothetical protein AYI70_g153 [Smittium culicis]|uniref:Uncharacterized protein n=1 Tax=Smittium culicis TaxID=133412 RepID=A0A1R1YHT9_9FUNG|nr:hypothetical protein AYI70_g153 [Smittium culicis]
MDNSIFTMDVRCDLCNTDQMLSCRYAILRLKKHINFIDDPQDLSPVQEVFINFHTGDAEKVINKRIFDEYTRHKSNPYNFFKSLNDQLRDPDRTHKFGLHMTKQQRDPLS